MLAFLYNMTRLKTIDPKPNSEELLWDKQADLRLCCSIMQRVNFDVVPLTGNPGNLLNDSFNLRVTITTTADNFQKFRENKNLTFHVNHPPSTRFT